MLCLNKLHQILWRTNMQISHIQSLIDRNANIITGLHEQVVYYKAYAYNHKLNGIPGAEYGYSNADKISKRIAKLSALQRSLKKELFHTLLDEAFLRTLTDGYVTGEVNYE
jgi:hypothetical protein